MADNLFTATRNYVRIIILAKEFPEANTVWQKLFTVAGMRQALAERRFLRQNESRISLLAIAFCGVSLHGLSDDPSVIAKTVGYIRKAQALDPEFFRENAYDSMVKETLEYLERHDGQVNVTA
jgi:hypothetical protein